MIRRAILAALLLAWGASPSSPYGGSGPSFPTGVVQLLTLYSTSGAQVAINTPSPPMFGLQFPSCSVSPTTCIPAGEYPKLQATDGTLWPATFINRASWSDGSIKHISVLPGPFPKAIPTTGVSAQVLNSPTPPTASGISLASLYDEGCQVNANGFASTLGTGLKLQGNWAARLVNDANVAEVVAYGDGGGGPVWRILTHVQSSGTPHGQMEVYWYVQGVVNASGTLAGWRFMPRLTQPWYNVSSPTREWRGLQDFTIECGATTVTPPFQYTTATFLASSWTGTGCADGTPNCLTPQSTPNWLTGNTTNAICGYFTTNGTLPAGVNANQMYIAKQYEFSTPTVFSDGLGTLTIFTSGGSGTHTFHPVPCLPHFGTLWGAQANGRPTYFQGAGSIATDAPIRIAFDNTARKATRVFPPFDLTLSPPPTANSANGDGSYPYAFDLMTIGPVQAATSGTGERCDIGVLTCWQARHFYNQTATDELYVRLIGLGGAYFNEAIRDGSTLGPIHLGDPANSYTGMPASSATSFAWFCGSSVGTFTGPVHTFSQFTCNEPSHRPHQAAYAYLVTGEPQYLDLEMEAANGSIATWGIVDTPGLLPFRNPTLSATTYYGIMTYSSDNALRRMAWGLRPLVFASGLWPDTDPAGTQIGAYLTALRTSNVNFTNLWLAASNSYLVSTGFWLPLAATNSWVRSYFVYVMCLAAALDQDTYAVTFLNSMATYYNHILTTFSGWQLHDFWTNAFPASPGLGLNPGDPPTGTPLTSDAQFASTFGVGNDITGINWSHSTSPSFTWVFPSPSYAGFVPTNGDKIVWPAAAGGVAGTNTGIPGGFTAATPYYAINVSGNNFDLAATVGGTRIVPSDNGTPVYESMGLVAAAPLSTGIFTGYPTSEGYVANFYGSQNWMIALGIAGLTSLAADTLTRMNWMIANYSAGTMGAFFQTEPKYAVGSSF